VTRIASSPLAVGEGLACAKVAQGQRQSGSIGAAFVGWFEYIFAYYHVFLPRICLFSLSNPSVKFQ
jgi:hypothetical protein